MCFEFVWDKKRVKIETTTAVHNISQGGINVSRIKLYIRSPKVTYIKKLVRNTQMTRWKKILQYSCPEHAGSKDYGPKLVTTIKTHPFWNATFQAYEDFV